MKKHLILIVLMFLTATVVISQSKSKQKEAAPTADELEAMMKEMQQEMEDLDPETKRMMDSMGVNMSMPSMPQVTDAQLQEAYEDENRIVPKRDDARIAGISKTPLTNASIGAFILSSHTKVTTRITSASKAKGEEIYRSVKAQYNSVTATGNTAAGLWMLGKNELAMYVMGKACIDNPTNINNLNNYAAMLSMNGGEVVALPVLNFINKRSPKNSTILNNLGQAWFGLGEIDKANSYLDSAIRIYAYHPQAAFTKSFIEESKGRQSAAVELVKHSIKKAYNKDKETRLNKLGYTLERDDLNWDAPMPQDPLGFHGFISPAYPLDVMQSKMLENEWISFRQSIQNEITSLDNRLSRLQQEAAAATQKRTQHLMDAGKKGIWVDVIPPLAFKAMVKLKYLVDDKDGHREASYNRVGKAVATANVDAGRYQQKLAADLELVRKKYEDQFGEGRKNPTMAACKDENGAKNAFLLASNPPMEEANKGFLKLMERKLADDLYYSQYTMWPEDFEVAKVAAKLGWLGLLTNQRPAFQNQSAFCSAADPLKTQPFKLAAFDDVNCMYHSKLTTPVGTITIDCSRMTTQLDLKFLKLGLKQDMDKETFGDQFMSCTVEVGAGVGTGVNAGPISAEAAIGGAIAAEFDRNGLRDVILKGSASVSAGTDIIEDGSMAGLGVSDVSVEVGVQGQVSIISGISSMGLMK
jgi:Flp pilus assembly protein TadD